MFDNNVKKRKEVDYLLSIKIGNLENKLLENL